MNDLTNAVLQLAAVAVTVFGGRALTRLADWLGVKKASETLSQTTERLKQDQVVRDYLLPIVDIAVDAGRQRILNALRKAPDADLAAERAREIDAIASYVLGKADGALQHFGIDAQGLKDMIDVRLPHDLSAMVPATAAISAN